MTKLKTITPPRDIVDAPCEYAPYCGGCKTQNLSYEAQLRAKEEQVRDLVVHVGRFPRKEMESHNIVKPIVPCDIQFHYRNKVSDALDHFKECFDLRLFLYPLYIFTSSSVFFLILVYLRSHCMQHLFYCFCRWNSHLVPINGYLENYCSKVIMVVEVMLLDCMLRAILIKF